jgi:hypothetical protein
VRLHAAIKPRTPPASEAGDGVFSSAGQRPLELPAAGPDAYFLLGHGMSGLFRPRQSLRSQMLKS